MLGTWQQISLNNPPDSTVCVSIKPSHRAVAVRKKKHANLLHNLIRHHFHFQKVKALRRFREWINDLIRSQNLKTYRTFITLKRMYIFSASRVRGNNDNLNYFTTNEKPENKTRFQRS